MHRLKIAALRIDAGFDLDQIAVAWRLQRRPPSATVSQRCRPILRRNSERVTISNCGSSPDALEKYQSHLSAMKKEKKVHSAAACTPPFAVFDAAFGNGAVALGCAFSIVPGIANPLPSINPLSEDPVIPSSAINPSISGPPTR